MSTTWTSLHPDEALLISRLFFKTAGTFNATVPAGAKFVRAIAEGCGGQGDHWGGSGAYAVKRVPVTAGDNLKIQVGNVSTATVAGDSWVERNDSSVICYADRGRGNSNKGLASNSIGDVTRDGVDGGSAGAAPPTDAADTGPLGFQGVGGNISTTVSASYGGGGHLFQLIDEFGDAIGLWAIGAGSGRVCLEFFDSDPGY